VVIFDLFYLDHLQDTRFFFEKRFIFTPVTMFILEIDENVFTFNTLRVILKNTISHRGDSFVDNEISKSMLVVHDYKEQSFDVILAHYESLLISEEVKIKIHCDIFFTGVFNLGKGEKQKDLYRFVCPNSGCRNKELILVKIDGVDHLVCQKERDKGLWRDIQDW
jgi:hypothetical protein